MKLKSIGTDSVDCNFNIGKEGKYLVIGVENIAKIITYHY